MERRTAIGISDKYRFYSFILTIDDQHRAGIYVPDYEPSVYNSGVDAYRLRFAIWYGSRVDWVDVLFYRYDCLATPEFREGGHVYNEFIPIVREAVDGNGFKHNLSTWLAKKEEEIEPTVYVSLTVLVDDGLGNLIENPDFNSGQGTILLANKDKKYGIKLVSRNGNTYVAPFGPTVAESDTPFGPDYNPKYQFHDDKGEDAIVYEQGKTIEFIDVCEDDNGEMVWGMSQLEASSYSIFKSFAKDGEQFDDIKMRVYLMDEEAGYKGLEAETTDIVEEDGVFYVRNIELKDLLEPFKNKPATPGLKIQATITIKHDITAETCEQELNETTKELEHNIIQYNQTNQIMSYITNIIPVDDELLGSVFIESNFTIENIYNSDMTLNPMIIKDVTEQTVVEMKVDGDKNHIVQPIFFRVREAANITIHPYVKENICINLDAYKSAVDSFRIKIEGVTFQETARLEAGIVFNISGTMLPGTQGAGTYYILNEEGDLVTTGKYTYEY